MQGIAAGKEFHKSRKGCLSCQRWQKTPRFRSRPFLVSTDPPFAPPMRCIEVMMMMRLFHWMSRLFASRIKAWHVAHCTMPRGCNSASPRGSGLWH
eukprot:366050-Chlamydomonas_euryale.AAC.3